MQISSIKLIERTLPGATTTGQSGPGSNDNEEILCIPQSSNINLTSQLDCLVSCLGHLLRGGHPSAEMQSLYSTAPANWANEWWEFKFRYWPVKVGFRQTYDLNPCSVKVINTSWKDNLLSSSFTIVNYIDGLIEFTWSSGVRMSSW